MAGLGLCWQYNGIITTAAAVRGCVSRLLYDTFGLQAQCHLVQATALHAEETACMFALQPSFMQILVGSYYYG